MSEEINLSLFTIAGLAHRCRQETDLFFQYLENDERFCFELFRRAIMYKNEHAWNLVVQQYSYQVAAWIKRNEFYAMADESIDYFTNQAFTNFWRAFSRDVHKLEKFSSLKALLRYLQLCAHTAVKEYVTRRTNPSLVTRSRYLRPEADESTNPASRVEEHGRAEYIWQCVLEKIKTEQERLIAEAYFIYDIKPREIYTSHPETFVSIDQVRRIKDNLLTRLRRNKQLLDILNDDG